MPRDATTPSHLLILLQDYLIPHDLALILLQVNETFSIKDVQLYVIGRRGLAMASRRYMRHNKLPESESAAARVGLAPDGDASGKRVFHLGTRSVI